MDAGSAPRRASFFRVPVFPPSLNCCCSDCMSRWASVPSAWAAYLDSTFSFPSLPPLRHRGNCWRAARRMLAVGAAHFLGVLVVLAHRLAAKGLVNVLVRALGVVVHGFVHRSAVAGMNLDVIRRPVLGYVLLDGVFIFLGLVL